MKIMEYTAQTGLRDIDFEPRQEGDDDRTWRMRAGFERLIDSFGFDELPAPHVLRIYKANDEHAEWHALVYVGDSGAEMDLIAVRTRSDLLHLRIFLKPLIEQMFMVWMAPVATIAMRAFCAWHEHEWDDPCARCAPLAMYVEEVRNRRRL
jgi:hypothetical protein